jgi:hypothetical protein
MGTNAFLDEHLVFCRTDVDTRLGDVTEQVRRVRGALVLERDASGRCIAELEARVAQLERALTQIGWTHCGKHDVLYVRTDENQCPACWRGE